MSKQGFKDNRTEVKQFISENSSLFWSVEKDAMENISDELLVETMLSYGNEKSVKKLLDLLGIKKVAEIFYRQIAGQRVNYKPRTIHFFDLYFKKYV